MLLPGIIGVALFGFTLSYDEIARTALAAGSKNTLPLEIWAMTTNVTSPTPLRGRRRHHHRVVRGDHRGADLHWSHPTPAQPTEQCMTSVRGSGEVSVVSITKRLARPSRSRTSA